MSRPPLQRVLWSRYEGSARYEGTAALSAPLMMGPITALTNPPEKDHPPGHCSDQTQRGLVLYPMLNQHFRKGAHAQVDPKPACLKIIASLGLSLIHISEPTRPRLI
eukprot:2042231-Amphidinium_carterae.1